MRREINPFAPRRGAVRVRNRTYPLNTELHRVLAMLTVLKDDSLAPQRRMRLALKRVTRRVPGDAALLRELFSAVTGYLFPGGPDSGGAALDFGRDAGLILAAFLRYYHLDLRTARMDYSLFRDLLSSLPDDCALKRTVRLRADGEGNAAIPYEEAAEALYGCLTREPIRRNCE